MWHIVGYWSFALATYAYALARGGSPERCGAAIFLASNLLSIAVVRGGYAVRFHAAEDGLFVVDAVTYLVFALLALRAERYWTIWVAALQGIAVLVHVAVASSPAFVPASYTLLVVIVSWAIILLLAVGTYRHRLRLQTLGADASWRPSSPRSAPPPTLTPRR